MRITLKIAPRFRTKEFTDEIIRKQWMTFQRGALNVGARVFRYMRLYINQYRKRKGTGNLAKSVTFEKEVGMARFWFGIGDINVLNANAPYWYVLNYGKKFTGGAFIPGGGKWRPVRFNGTPAKGGTMGNQRATAFVPIGGGNVPRVIRPLRYIDASTLKFDIEFRMLLAQLR